MEDKVKKKMLKGVWCWHFWPQHLHTEGSINIAIKEQSNTWHGFYTARRENAGESEDKGVNLEFQIQNEGRWDALQMPFYLPPAGHGEQGRAKGSFL